MWYAARALLAGQDPYEVIGPHLPFPFPWPFFYPLPAALVALPIAPLPELVARSLFVSISGGCFAWALMQHGYGPLLGFLSAAMIVAVELAQWSPIMAAAVVLMPLGVTAAAKPTLGAAVFLARPSRWMVLSTVILWAIAFVLQPAWFSNWIRTLLHASARRPLHFRAPIMHPGGILVLLAMLRWRRPEARLLTAMACVPQSMILYETVPLFLVPRTLIECVALVVLSYAAQVGMVLSKSDLILGGRWIVLLLYLPATIMVLRRPNRGPATAWLERRVAKWPSWVRGAAITSSQQ